MPYQLESRLVVGVSARALFDMTRENEIFEKQGLEAYCRYQAEHEQDILKPGPGFGLIKALLKLNEGSGGKNPVEVIVMSHNSPETSLRVFHAISGYGLPITRAVLASGASPARYLAAFHTDLFLSPCEEDVQYAIDNGIAAGVICTECSCAAPRAEEIRIAFDAQIFFDDQAVHTASVSREIPAARVPYGSRKKESFSNEI